MNDQSDRAARFVALHARHGAFVIPNPWDVGSARLFAGIGFEALATTSSGFANALGRSDGEVSLAEKVTHCQALSAATALPVSADLENGFDDAPEAVAQAIRAVADAGVIGASIEDFSGSEIYDFELAVERLAAAVETARSMSFPFTLTARAENLLRGRDDMDDTIRRLQAFERAGADVLYAPGLKTLEQVREVASAISNPINVLGPMVRGASVGELADAGAKRISVGGALARLALANVVRASRELHDEGGFGWVAGLAPAGDIDALVRAGVG